MKINAKLLYLTLLIIINIKIINAQPVTWQRYYNYENGNDFAHDAIQTFDGGYLIIGDGRSSTVFKGCYLLKLDYLGNLEWKKLIGGADERKSVKKVEQLSDSSYLFIGNSFDSLLLLKTNNKGEVEWEKKFNENNGESRGYSLRITSDNEIILCGSVFFNSPSLRTYPYVIKTDIKGNLIWKKYYEDMLNIVAFDIVSINNSEFVFCASKYLRKIDSVGNVIKTNSFWKGSGSLWLNCLVYVKPNIIYSGGVSNIDFESSFHALKVSTNDSLYWNNRIVIPENIIGDGNAICFSRGSLYMTGVYNKKGVVPFVKISDFGEMKLYNLISESMEIESYGNSIRPAQDGGFILSATTRFGPTSSYKYLAIKTDSNGYAPKLVNIEFSNVYFEDFFLYQNYPNPFNPATNINFKIPDRGFVSLKIYDTLGKEIAALVNEQKSPGSYEVEFDGKDLSSGIYFYSLLIDGKIIETKSMVLLK